MRHFEQIIIGAGFSGICMGIKLREAGFRNFIILERDEQPGGTWFVNTYPGAACDVQSHLYSFSFEPNPNWSRMFSPQPEIWQYMQHCVTKYGLQPHLQCGTTVNHAAFDENSSEWEVRTGAGEVFRCRHLISCMGGLSQPALPDVKGIDEFEGHKFHTAQWNHEVDLSDKTVAVIGTGASAIQVVPAIAPRVKKLLLFQRTPPWILPKADRPMSSFEQQLFSRFPFMQKLMRLQLYLRNEMLAGAFVSHPAILRFGQRIAIGHLKKQVKDEALRKQLIPHYVMGCKRILLSNDYYPALQRENVALIPQAVERISARALHTTSGDRHEADVIVFATGFQASDDILKFDVIGRNGINLKDVWKQGPEAYRGTTVHGFPNLFFVIGPNTGLGHNSIILMTEAQVNYIIKALLLVGDSRAGTLEVKQPVQAAYNRWVQQKLGNSVWQSGGCRSWYQNRNGKNIAIWPGSTFAFMRMMRTFDAAAYEMQTAPSG